MHCKASRSDRVEGIISLISSRSRTLKSSRSDWELSNVPSGSTYWRPSQPQASLWVQQGVRREPNIQSWLPQRLPMRTKSIQDGPQRVGLPDRYRGSRLASPGEASTNNPRNALKRNRCLSQREERVAVKNEL
eukprot:5038063-Amphidinium_carterae.1